MLHPVNKGAILALRAEAAEAATGQSSIATRRRLAEHRLATTARARRMSRAARMIEARAIVLGLLVTATTPAEHADLSTLLELLAEQ